MIRDETEWIDISNSDLTLARCDDCGEDPAMQVHQGAEGYRVACGCSSARGNTTEEAAEAWNTMMEEGARLPDPMPPTCAPEEKIYLRLALSAEGALYLYDAATGRPVAYQMGMRVQVVDQAEEIQAAVIEVFTDGRLIDERAQKAIQKRRVEEG